LFSPFQEELERVRAVGPTKRFQVEGEMFRRWEDAWMNFGLRFAPNHVALAYLFVNDELKALVQFHGTTQRYFYTVTQFEGGTRTDLPEHFPSIAEAKAAIDS
jgi:hypothetical protein